MKIQILGSSAGGGFPQWNCNCRQCAGLRDGTLRARPRTQSSIAVGDGGANWVLFNASPDLLAQIKATPALQPGRALRDSGIAGIVLVDGQIDHTTGLLMLREGGQMDIWCTDEVAGDLSTDNPLFKVLEHYCQVRRHAIDLDGRPFTVPAVPNIRFTAVPLVSKAPPYSAYRQASRPGDNIGILIEGGDQRVFYAPGFGLMEPHLEPLLRDVDCVLIDGTFWTDDEMIRLGISRYTARAIGHLPQSGPDGMIELLSRYPRPRKILIHINNTNPILDEDSQERAELTAAGIEVAFDGMEIDFGSPT